MAGLGNGDDAAGGVRRLGRRAARRLARRVAPPLRRLTRGARRTPHPQHPGRQRARALRGAALAARPRAGAGTHPGRDAGELRAGRGHRRAGRRDPGGRRVRRRRSDSGRTSISCGDSTRPAGRAGTSRPSRPTTRRVRRGGRGYASASTTDRRRRRSRSGTRVVWRRCEMSGWSAGAWALAAVGHPLAGVVVGAGSAAALVPKLADVPPLVSLRIAGLGNLHAGRLLADAVRRVWWPIVLVAAIRSRRARLIALASLLPAPPSRPPRRRHGVRRRRVEGHVARTHHRPPDPPLHLLARPLPPRPVTRPSPVIPSTIRTVRLVHRRRRARSFCPKTRTATRRRARAVPCAPPSAGSCRPRIQQFALPRRRCRGSVALFGLGGTCRPGAPGV